MHLTLQSVEREQKVRASIAHFTYLPPTVDHMRQPKVRTALRILLLEFIRLNSPHINELLTRSVSHSLSNVDFRTNLCAIHNSPQGDNSQQTCNGHDHDDTDNGDIAEQSGVILLLHY